MTTAAFTASTFREPVLRALGTLTNLRANVPVPMKDVSAAVAAETGFVPGDHGERGGKEAVQWAIGRAYFLAKRDEHIAPPKMKRGMWGLSEQGVGLARTLLLGTDAQVTEPEPVAVEPVAVEPVAIAAEPAEEPEPIDLPEPTSEGGSGVSLAIDFDGEDSYHADPYIRSLAVQATSCFGKWSARSGVCSECALSVACKGRLISDLSALGASLTLRDVEAKAKAEAEAARKIREANATKHHESSMSPGTRAVEGMVEDDTIDEILAELEGTSTATVPDPETAAAPAGVPSDGQIIEVVVPTICAKCDKTIPTGDQGWWVAGKGMFHHPKCP